MTVKDVRNLVKLPVTMQLQVAAMLPSGGLAAMSAVDRLRPFIEYKINKKKDIGKYDTLFIPRSGNYNTGLVQYIGPKSMPKFGVH